MCLLLHSNGIGFQPVNIMDNADDMGGFTVFIKDRCGSDTGPNVTAGMTDDPDLRGFCGAALQQQSGLFPKLNCVIRMEMGTGTKQAGEICRFLRVTEALQPFFREGGGIGLQIPFKDNTAGLINNNMVAVDDRVEAGVLLLAGSDVCQGMVAVLSAAFIGMDTAAVKDPQNAATAVINPIFTGEFVAKGFRLFQQSRQDIPVFRMDKCMQRITKFRFKFFFTVAGQMQQGVAALEYCHGIIRLAAEDGGHEVIENRGIQQFFQLGRREVTFFLQIVEDGQ